MNVYRLKINFLSGKNLLIKVHANTAEHCLTLLFDNKLYQQFSENQILTNIAIEIANNDNPSDNMRYNVQYKDNIIYIFDTENDIIVSFPKGEYNNKKKITLLNDDTSYSQKEIENIMEEIGNFIIDKQL